MQGSAPPLNLVNRTPQRRELLGALSRQLPAKELVALATAIVCRCWSIVCIPLMGMRKSFAERALLA